MVHYSLTESSILSAFKVLTRNMPIYSFNRVVLSK